MINVFRNETQHCKLKSVERYFNTCGTWMCCKCGEGEEEIDNHGRSRVKVVSSQGTNLYIGRLKGLQVLRMRAKKPTQETVKKVQDARKTLTHSPFLFSISLSFSFFSYGGFLVHD